MYHKEWDRNAMVAAFFEDYADEINAKVEERVSERISKEISERKREMAKAMLADNVPVEKIAAYSGLSVEEIAQL
jgi:predicted transposase/invertase (TIGR01784 family)